ncbi:MAG: MerR family transcriptional regulator [Phycisphaerae bacterium]|nr:MerR family transcriptional regulator [Phycisphaerae bacterium]
MTRRKRSPRKTKTIGQMDLPYGNQEPQPPSISPSKPSSQSAQAEPAPTAAQDPPAGAKTGPLADSQTKPRPPKLYRIGEVVEYCGKSRQTVHNYTTMGLLPESRWTKGGHRLYDESVFERLDQITEMKAHGKSLEEIREYFAPGR